MNREAKWGVFLLILLCAAAAAALLLPRPSGEVVRIWQDGALLEEIDPNRLIEPRIYLVEGEHGLSNTVCVMRGRGVCVQSATCPDQICVHQGWINDGSLPIVCLPNRLVVEFVGEGGADAAVR